MKSPVLKQTDPKHFNPIINGAFDFFQRGNTLTSSPTTGYSSYFADRFKYFLSAGAAKGLTLNNTTSVPSSPYITANNSMQVVNDVAIASFPSGEYLNPIRQIIEGVIFTPIFGKDFTVGFWMNATFTGKISVSVQNHDSSRCFVSLVDVTPGWQHYVVQVPWDSGLINRNIDAVLSVDIGGVTGTDFQAPSLNSWLSGGYSSHANATVWSANTGTIFYITEVQIRSGSWSSDDLKYSFVRCGESYQLERLLCQRYYEKSWPSQVSVFQMGAHGYPASFVPFSYTQHFLQIEFKSQKRVTPSILLYDPSTATPGAVRESGVGVVGSTAYIGSEQGFAGIQRNSGNYTAAQIVSFHWEADGEL